MRRSTKNIGILSIRCFWGRVLILSTLLIISIDPFTQEVQLFIDLYLLDFLFEWNRDIAVTVCVSELAIGILELTGFCRMLVSIMIVIMFTSFLYLTSVNAFFPSKYYGSTESCGCFGELIHFTLIASFYRSMVLWGLSVISYRKAFRENGRYNDSNTILRMETHFDTNPMVYMVMRRNFEDINQYNRAYSLYRQAFLLHPNSVYPLYRQMKLYEKAGAKPRLAQKAQKIMSIKPKFCLLR